MKELHKRVSPDIVFLMETKNFDEFVLNELKFFESYNHLLVPPERPNSSGLALFWKTEINLTVISSSKNIIDTLASHKGISFYASFIYGEPEVANRLKIWDELESMASTRTDPWFLTGDFNEIIDNSEKMGGPLRAEGSFCAFRSFLSQCDIFDLKRSRNSLSWRGKRHNHLIFSRLDRALVNSLWSERFPTGRSHYLDFEGSDHRPIISLFDSGKSKNNKVFRYDMRLKDNQEVKDLIMPVWNSSEQAPLELRLSYCREAISRWSREQHANSRVIIENLKTQLNHALSNSVADDVLITRLNSELLKAYKSEEDFWRQRSRIMWLVSGDKNSGFVHAVLKGKRARNRLSVIEDTDGNAFFEEDHIAAQISKYFETIFTSTVSSNLDQEVSQVVNEALTPVVPDSANEALMTFLRVKRSEVLCSCSIRIRHLEPMGFRRAFSSLTGLLFALLFVKRFKIFFQTGNMKESMNLTHVRLIPKITSPELVSDYRPIALCNVTYKIITKLISLHLKSTLCSIISENQSAFVPGRAITDNILITHELLHSLKTSQAKFHCSMAVKTDMSKAYDRLEWDFIRKVLMRLGFCEQRTSRVMQYITSVSYSFLVNDSVQGHVLSSGGIRQGDPLSPYIFILCGEVLSGLCHKAQASGHMSGLQVARASPRINHLLFVDDTMFFVKTDELSCSALVEVLRKYEFSSGQMINIAKSSISFSSKTPQETRQRVHSQLGIMKEGGVEKYLGLPEHFGR